MNILRAVFLRLFSGKIQATGPSLTLIRLCTSRHLQDLQQIASFAILVYIFVCTVTISLSGSCSGPACSGEESFLLNKLLSFSAATSAVAAILSWTYQTGSKRIGTIDLFANEIAVICRVCLIVDFARHSILLSSPKSANADDADAPTQERQLRFVSQEQYTPVYDRNVSDLQPFDVDVVTSVTRFYTYRKTMVDYLRMLTIYDGAAHEAVKQQMIYMQYLMYESAREAIVLLVEFEPNQAENLINILCSELILFPYLYHIYKDDFRGSRLKIRSSEYGALMNDLAKRMSLNIDHRNWEKAQVTFPELQARYRSTRQTEG